MRQKRPIDAIFPWGSDSETDDELNIAAAKCLPDLPVKCDRKQPSIQTASIADGITYQYIPEHTQAGKVLAHCERCIEQLRRATGGESLAIYKIGITHSCAPRFELYHTNGWDKDGLLCFQSNDLGTIEMLEAALIAPAPPPTSMPQTSNWVEKECDFVLSNQSLSLRTIAIVWLQELMNLDGCVVSYSITFRLLHWLLKVGVSLKVKLPIRARMLAV